MKTPLLLGIGLLLFVSVVISPLSGQSPNNQNADRDAAVVEVDPNVERVSGKVSEVMLYQGNALVTRKVELPAGRQGAFELMVESLPTATDPKSVYADEAQGVEIRSVACRVRPTAEEERMKNEVALLEEAIKETKKKISDSNNEISLRRIRQDYLKNLGGFVAPAARQEMAHGVLQATELEEVTKMHFREYETASQEIMKYDFEIEDLREALADLEEERSKLAQGPPVHYDAIVYVEKAGAGPATLNLNYLVGDCGWNPTYNLRGDSGQGQAQLEFNALIHQVSGESWTDAMLTLSTASPTVSAWNPQLAPLYVQVSAGGSSGAAAKRAELYNRALAQKSEALKGQMLGRSIDEAATANFAANDSAASVQLFELSERLSSLRQISSQTTEDLSIQYELKKPVTLISRRSAQMVPVLSEQLPAEFYHVAAPILTASVFREAQLVNTADRDLMGGQVNVYLDSEFIGRTDIPTIARGTRYTLGFGVDGQLRARRSLTDRTETVQGGNRRVTISCALVIDSFKEKEVNIQLRERTPHMEDAMSLRVAMEDSSHPVSADLDYLRFERPKGILRWDLPVPPGIGENATTLNYTYSLEFDKNLTLQDISSEAKGRIREDFILRSKSAMKK